MLKKDMVRKLASDFGLKKKKKRKEEPLLLGIEQTFSNKKSVILDWLCLIKLGVVQGCL